MISTGHCESLFFAAVAVNLLGSFVSMIVPLSKFCSILPEAQLSEPSAIAEERSRQDFSTIYLAGKRVKLFYRGYSVLDRLPGAPNIPAEVLNVLEWPASFPVEPL